MKNYRVKIPEEQRDELTTQTKEVLDEWNKQLKNWDKEKIWMGVCSSYRDPSTWKGKRSEEEIEMIEFGQQSLLFRFLGLTLTHGDKGCEKFVQSMRKIEHSGGRIFSDRTIQMVLDDIMDQIEEEKKMENTKNEVNAGTVNTNKKENTVNKKDSMWKRIQRAYEAEKELDLHVLNNVKDEFKSVGLAWLERDIYRSFRIGQVRLKAEKILLKATKVAEKAEKASKERVNSDKFKKLSDKETRLAEKASDLKKEAEGMKGKEFSDTIRVLGNCLRVVEGTVLVSFHLCLGAGFWIGGKIFSFFSNLLKKDEVVAPTTVPVS